MKKVISINELILGVLLLSITFIIVLALLGLMAFVSISNILKTTFILALFNIGFSLLLVQINKCVWSKGLPSRCLRNPIGFIEIHIGENCNNDRFYFFIVCLETINIAIKEKKDILVDTWIVDPDDIKKYCGEAAEFLVPKMLQRRSNKKNKKKHAPESDKESYRCVIHVTELTDDQRKKIQQKLKRLTERHQRSQKNNI